MMGEDTPETCRAIHKRQVINLWNCCIWLVNSFESYDDTRTCEHRIEKYDRWRKHTAQKRCDFHAGLLRHGHKHTLIICNTYWLPMAIMVTRTRLSDMLNIHCMSCWNNKDFKPQIITKEAEMYDCDRVQCSIRKHFQPFNSDCPRLPPEARVLRCGVTELNVCGTGGLLTTRSYTSMKNKTILRSK
jgi:hypothetical protein